MTDRKRQRTCIACFEKKQQANLVRLVQEDSGRVIVDVRGKIAGRGAYVCSKKCLEASLSSGRLARALRMKIDTAAHDNILSEFTDKICIEDR